MVIAWTQVAGTALSISASGAWTDYNIASINSVPAGAVAFIVAANREAAANNIMGLRTNGSSINRYLNMSEAEDGGANLIGWYVKVASDGYIEYYTADYANTSFYLMGYWTGVDYTEYFAELAFTTSGGTYANNHFSMSSYSPAAGRVCTFALCNNRATTKETAGVRCGDAIYNKTISIHEAESGGVFGVFMATKTDASNQIEYYVESTTYVDAYITGVFDGNMSYVDRHVGNCYVSITSANTWTDLDCSSYIGEDGQVVDCVVMHNVVGAETNVGVRTNGTSDARYLLACEAEDNGYCGWTGPTKTDASGIIEFYCGNASYELMGINGYYIPANIVEKTATDAIGLADAVILTKSIVVTDSIGFADANALTKSMVITDTIGAVDTTPLSKTMYVADSISLAEAVALVKSLVTSDTITATDVVALIKSMVITDTISGTDAVAMVKALAVSEAIAVSDAVQMAKALLVSDTIGADDAVQMVKALLTTDALTASDSVTLSKDVVVADAISLDDATLLVKAIIITDALGLSDEATREILGTLTEFVVTDSITVSDTTVLGKVLLIADTITMSDAVVLSKALMVADTVALSDSAILNKALLVEESISADDVVVMVKSILVADGITLSDAATQVLLNLIHLRITALSGKKAASTLSGRKGGESLDGKVTREGLKG